jgi:hypothetical protein
VIPCPAVTTTTPSLCNCVGVARLWQRRQRSHCHSSQPDCHLAAESAPRGCRGFPHGNNFDVLDARCNGAGGLPSHSLRAGAVVSASLNSTVKWRACVHGACLRLALPPTQFFYGANVSSGAYASATVQADYTGQVAPQVRPCTHADLPRSFLT